MLRWKEHNINTNLLHACAAVGIHSVAFVYVCVCLSCLCCSFWKLWFIVCRYILSIYRSSSYIKVIRSMSRPQDYMSIARYTHSRMVPLGLNAKLLFEYRVNICVLFWTLSCKVWMLISVIILSEYSCGFVGVVSWWQCIRYGDQWSYWRVRIWGLCCYVWLCIYSIFTTRKWGMLVFSRVTKYTFMGDLPLTERQSCFRNIFAKEVTFFPQFVH